MSPVGSPEHARIAMRLYRAFIPVMDDHKWEGFCGNVDVCLDGSRDPLEPDFVIAPLNCPRWGERELLSSGLLLVAEVVSQASKHDDWVRKPAVFAGGGVPLLLLVDPLATPRTVTVMSEPREGRYQTSVTAAFGAEIYIPAPVDFMLDTSVFEEVL